MVTYDEAALNSVHDEFQQLCAKVKQISIDLDGEDTTLNNAAPVIIGFNGLIEWAHNNKISLVEFLAIIELESQNVIAEMQMIHSNMSKAVN